MKDITGPSVGVTARSLFQHDTCIILLRGVTSTTLSDLISHQKVSLHERFHNGSAEIFAQLLKSGFKMAIYLSFLIVHAMPTNARATPSAWNHKHDRVSDFVPIASLLEWQWRRIVMRNGQFYHSSRNGASETAQCREIPHLFPEPFYQVLQARVGEPTTYPPPLPTRCFHQKLDQVQEILERPSEGEQAPPKCRYEAIVIGRVGIWQEK